MTSNFASSSSSPSSSLLSIYHYHRELIRVVYMLSGIHTARGTAPYCAASRRKFETRAIRAAKCCAVLRSTAHSVTAALHRYSSRLSRSLLQRLIFTLYSTSVSLLITQHPNATNINLLTPIRFCILSIITDSYNVHCMCLSRLSADRR